MRPASDFNKCVFLQIHAGNEQGSDNARVPRADDGVPVIALERVSARNA